MGASRYLVGFVCLGLVTGCAESADLAGEELNLAYEAAVSPDLPPPPAGATCVLIQRGTLGQCADTDVSFGNGNWAPGDYPATWTGPSPYNHWSLYRFDLSPVPANATVVLGVFSNYVSWNELHSTVRAHRINKAWSEATETWASFTLNGTITGWDPAIEASFDPEGVGFHSIDVTATVQDWHSGAYPNNGLLLEEDPVKQHNYFASETGWVDARPNLYVCYVDGAPNEECAAIENECDVDADCCDGLVCINGNYCGVPLGGGQPQPQPPQECAADGAACDLDTPCCDPTSTCDGICYGTSENGGNDGGDENACFPIGASCEGDAECCSGVCGDGLCSE
jgi:hypothetical protein